MKNIPVITRQEANKSKPIFIISCSVLKDAEKDNKCDRNHVTHCQQTIIPKDVHITENINPWFISSTVYLESII